MGVVSLVIGLLVVLLQTPEMPRVIHRAPLGRWLGWRCQVCIWDQFGSHSHQPHSVRALLVQFGSSISALFTEKRHRCRYKMGGGSPVHYRMLVSLPSPQLQS